MYGFFYRFNRVNISMIDLNKINEMIAVKATTIIGTMWCVYVFIVFCLLPTLFPSLQNQLLYISNCMQLIFLPLIMVGSAVMNKASETRAIHDHKKLMQEFKLLKEILADTQDQDKLLTEILAGVQSLQPKADI